MTIINSTIKGKTPVIESLNVTPSTSAQQITAPTGTDGYSPVNVSAVTSSIDANIVAGNIKDGVTILGVTGDYTGGGGGKYQLLDRVKDDTDKDIGCVVGYHTDANNQKYAVVCLNKEFRNFNSYQWLSGNVMVTDLPFYATVVVFDALETATFNCDKILAMAPDYTSSAVAECRNHSFVIDGITYYGQLPNLTELLYIMMNRTTINDNDPSVTGAIISWATPYWASSQANDTTGWRVYSSYASSNISASSKTDSSFRVCPILEIPIN